MPSRFWRASGNALLPGKGLLGPAAAAGTQWNTSAGSPASSADWTVSTTTTTNDHAERNSASAFWAVLWGSAAKVSGTIIVTVNALSGTSDGVRIGFDRGTETTGIGGSASTGVGYRQDGAIFLANGVNQTGLATLSAGDKLKVVKATGTVTFYKWNTGTLAWDQQGSAVNVASAGTGIEGAVYPAVSTGNTATGTKVTADFSGW